MTLQKTLENFKGTTTEEELTKYFKNILAPAFLYGGYYSVYGKYRIYIKTIEFYFHAENDSKFKITDPIVYHRNNKYVEGEVPYFPPMALHAHASGLDITFENEENKYRASALIRAYEVYDEVRKCFLVYNKEKAKFVMWETKTKKHNEQSTYLYNFLNGFCNNSIKWEDDQWDDKLSSGHKELIVKTRKNVYKTHSKDKNVYFIDKGLKKESDGREWSFTRTDNIEIKLNLENSISYCLNRRVVE